MLRLVKERFIAVVDSGAPIFDINDHFERRRIRKDEFLYFQRMQTSSSDVIRHLQAVQERFRKTAFEWIRMPRLRDLADSRLKSYNDRLTMVERCIQLLVRKRQYAPTGKEVLARPGLPTISALNSNRPWACIATTDIARR